MSKVRSKVDQLGDSHTYLFRRLHAVSRVKESFARILRSCCHFPFYDLPGRKTDDGDILDARRPAGTGRLPSAGPALEDMAQDQMVAGRSARRRPMSLTPRRCSSRARTKHRSTTSSRTTGTARSSSSSARTLDCSVCRAAIGRVTGSCRGSWRANGADFRPTFRRSDKSEKSQTDGNIQLYQVFMATPAGLEPATYCLEGSCSIQLS